MPDLLAAVAAFLGVILLGCAGAVLVALRYQPPPPAAVVELAQAPSGWRHRLHTLLVARRVDRVLTQPLPLPPIPRPAVEAPPAAPGRTPAPTQATALPAGAGAPRAVSPYARDVFDGAGRITLPDDEADAIITWHTTVAQHGRDVEHLLAPGTAEQQAPADTRIRLAEPERAITWAPDGD